MKKLRNEEMHQSKLNQRIIKNEVIEMADRLETMEKQLKMQRKQIESQQSQLKIMNQAIDPNPQPSQYITMRDKHEISINEDEQEENMNQGQRLQQS